MGPILVAIEFSHKLERSDRMGESNDNAKYTVRM